jgi:large subunit ribosomal protein L17
MRHLRAGVHLSRTASHRKALFSNLVAALINEGRIKTTDAKAKETRRLAERTITWARRLGPEVLTKKADKRSPEEKAQVVHAMRMARRMVRDRGAVIKLFDEIGPRYLSRPGGYTRIVKVGQRPGDAAPMSILELIPEDAAPAAKKAEAPEGKGKEKKAAKAAGKEGAPKASKGGAAPKKAPKAAKKKDEDGE